MQWYPARIAAMPRVVELLDDTYGGFLSAYGLNVFFWWLPCDLGFTEYQLFNVSCRPGAILWRANRSCFIGYRKPEYFQHLDSLWQLCIFPRIWHDVDHGIVMQLFHMRCHMVSPVLRRRYYVHETISADPGSDIDHSISTDLKYECSPSSMQVFLPNLSLFIRL